MNLVLKRQRLLLSLGLPESAIITASNKPRPLLRLQFVGGEAKEASEKSNRPPNLRQAGKNNRPKQFIAAACILVAIYMYPMIFRPMFGLNTVEQSETTKKAGIDPDKLRPSYMPEWSNPFGPRGTKKNN